MATNSYRLNMITFFKVEVAVYGPREIPKRSDFSMKGKYFYDFWVVSKKLEFVRGHWLERRFK